MKSALIEIDEALLRLLFLWWLGFAAGIRNQAATKKRGRRRRRLRRRRRTTKTKQIKNKNKNKNKKMVKKKKKKRKTQSIKQSKAKQSPTLYVPCFFCMSVCVSVSVCVFCQVLSFKSTRNGCLTGSLNGARPLARLFCSNVVCRNCSIHEAQGLNCVPKKLPTTTVFADAATAEEESSERAFHFISFNSFCFALIVVTYSTYFYLQKQSS
jgi:hypothetical protein